MVLYLVWRGWGGGGGGGLIGFMVGNTTMALQLGIADRVDDKT